MAVYAWLPLQLTRHSRHSASAVWEQGNQHPHQAQVQQRGGVQDAVGMQVLLLCVFVVWPAGSQVVVAESYARIFFRNCMSTGELYPVETDLRLCDELKTGGGAGRRRGRAGLGSRSGSSGASALREQVGCWVLHPD